MSEKPRGFSNVGFQPVIKNILNRIHKKRRGSETEERGQRYVNLIKKIKTAYMNTPCDISAMNCLYMRIYEYMRNMFSLTYRVKYDFKFLGTFSVSCRCCFGPYKDTIESHQGLCKGQNKNNRTRGPENLKKSL